jgi:gamma-glutamylcyclotransferase (GGCT)/AIG2-like uncharacterized protein YtfP
MTTTFIPTEAEAEAHSQDTDRLPVFVYGTLRPGHGNARIWDGYAFAKFDGKCRIHDHKLVSNGGFPYCIPDQGSESYGCLIVPTGDNYDHVLRRMDALEGVPMHYTREIVAVTCPEGVITAWVYIPAFPSDHSDLRDVFGNDWTLHTRRLHTDLDAGWHS